MMRRLKQSGDTLVEVLIAIAVLSSVLGGAYAASNRSLRVSRQNQERGEALKVAETQLEKLKALTSVPAGDFCFAAGSITTSGSPCLITEGGVTYSATISQPGSGNFQIKIDWPNVHGSQDNLELWYRK